MGYYLNSTLKGPLGARDKANGLITNAEAELLFDPPRAFEDIPTGKALVCVLHNGPFDAALLVHDENELKVTLNGDDRRPKTWLLMEKKLAFMLAGLIITDEK